MNRNDVCIATLTWARNEKEEVLLRDCLQQLASINIPVFITDGGSGISFLNFLRSIPHFHIVPSNDSGVWAQVRNSLLAANNTNRPFIFYTEPDKKDFFNNGLAKMLDKFQPHKMSGIMIASRSAESFRSFPAFQQMIETTINNCCAEVIGKAVDYSYGPFLMRSQLLPYLGAAQEDIGWGWRPYIFTIAHRLGYNTETFTDHFFCPPEQQEDTADERLYRIKQLSQNMQGLLLSATANLDKE